MRNLKKFLALVLAFMMTMSLMVTVNASTVSDVADVEKDFQEAVKVLNGMEVIKGFPDGQFHGEQTIKRSEVAAIVYRLATGDYEDLQAHLYKKNSFPDVKEAAWYSGYVGYCYEFNLIGGYEDGNFYPDREVTGYEALKMILRAVGWGENGEFEGPKWASNVLARANLENILVNVNNTSYKSTLSQPANRQLVAEIMFQAAQIPTVVYQLGTYNRYTTMVTVAGQDNQLRPSLGETYYGLTYIKGIVIANQETLPQNVPSNNRTTLSSATYADKNGVEYWDKNSVSYNPGHVKATYAVGGGTAGSNTINFDLQTGLDKFGHKMKVWYDNRGVNILHTYANIDESTKSDLVWVAANSSKGGNVATGTAADNDLGNLAVAMGYAVDGVSRDDLTPVGSVYISDAFAPFYDAQSGDDTHASYNVADKQSAANVSPSNVYMLISNRTDPASGKPVLDAVVSLNVEATTINAVNNNVVAADKTITVGYGDNFQSKNVAIAKTGDTNNTVVMNTSIASPTAGSVGLLPIKQNKLSANSTITLGDKVIVNALGDINPAGDISSYNVAKLAETKTGKVVSYYNGTNINTDPSYVILEDGTKLVKSPLYNVVVSGIGTSETKWSSDDTLNTATSWDGRSTVIRQAETSTNGTDRYSNLSLTYEFYISPVDGKYVGTAPLTGSELIYGTYLDYEQQLSSSTFKYYLTGINENGEQVTRQVETITTAGTPATITSTSMTGIGVPYRDGGVTTITNGLGQGAYNLFTLSNTALDTDINTVPGFRTTGDLDSNITIGSAEKVLGTVKVADNSDGNPIYFTEKTKFILVEGYGTDTAKATVKNGITELLGNSRQAIINLDNDDAVNNCGNGNEDLSKKMPGITPATVLNTMAFWKTSAFVYDQTHNPTAYQADVIFLPKEAVKYVGSSDIFYVGNNVPTLVTANSGEKATQFTMYDTAGEAHSMWIEGWTTDGSGSAWNIYDGTQASTVYDNVRRADTFYELTNTGKTTSDGSTIYAASAHASTATTRNGNADYAKDGTIDRKGTGIGTYIATTRDAQNAMIRLDSTTLNPTYRVSGAKVVNLSDKGDDTVFGPRYPGIADLATLNGSSSVRNPMLDPTVNPVHVSAVVANDGFTVTTIFVCYNQRDNNTAF